MRAAVLERPPWRAVVQAGQENVEHRIEVVARDAAGETATAGMTTPRIHTDMERGFIRAEVMPYVVFMAHGSEHAVKEAGLLQVEGKEYVVQDGDILHIRFAV